ncbi:MAG: hypothetical protein NTV81_03915 [Candidatus Komeilibacteria bacterium]|nr:hypothetical protein [Candidatus Komeilibacteria bacterium]
MAILLGFIVVLAGFLFIWKNHWIVEYFGRIAWAEEKFSLSGGTFFFWKMFGLLTIFLGFMIMFNLIGGLLLSIFGRAFSNQL